MFHKFFENQIDILRIFQELIWGFTLEIIKNEVARKKKIVRILLFYHLKKKVAWNYLFFI